MVVSCAFTAMVLMGIVAFSSHIIDRTRAQIAADASALASIYGGANGAEVVARRNGATLLRLQGDGNSVQTVQVRVGRYSATASARDSWVGDLPTMTP